MSEPQAGSDLQSLRTQARRRSDNYELHGQKGFVTNGQIADLIIVAAKTEPEHGLRGISLFMVESGETKGFQRGSSLDKIGLPASDPSELFFENAVVPSENLLGTEGQGFPQLTRQGLRP
jgi:acyl-CoA dehydrogenase